MIGSCLPERARQAEHARKAEEARKAEGARQTQEMLQILEESRIEEERHAEEARQAEELEFMLAQCKQPSESLPGQIARSTERDPAKVSGDCALDIPLTELLMFAGGAAASRYCMHGQLTISLVSASKSHSIAAWTPG